MERDEREYVPIDTAGACKRGKITDAVEKFSVIKTLQAMTLTSHRWLSMRARILRP